jgi:putative nucleotidyltransferase with HDIG domain
MHGISHLATSDFDLKSFIRSTLSLLALLAIILATRIQSYLLFHSLAELTSVAIGATVFIIAWNSARLEQNNYLLIIGLGLGFVAIIDLLHMLAFKGMMVFPNDDSLGAQLWLSARYVQALAFLIALFYLHYPLDRRLPVAGFTVVTLGLLASIFVWDIFPATYHSETGLTPFKVGSEYVIIAAFVIATILLWYNRTSLDPKLLYMLTGSLVASIASETAFTLYFGVTDTANLVGHLFKIIAFFLLYLALVETAFNRPYDLLFRQLKQEEENQRAGRTQAEVELLQAYDETIKGWSHALDLRDKETEWHTLRVTELTIKLAQEAGLSEKDILNIQRGALLHDIGKMGVPDHILLKSDKLTKEEWDIMRTHPQLAFDMLSPIAYLHSALDIPYCHHEKWDGSGYPRGLKGEQIPLAARLFAIVDVWDALCSDRPYRARWSEEKVIEYILSLSGVHFDPKVVELFINMRNKGGLK